MPMYVCKCVCTLEYLHMYTCTVCVYICIQYVCTYVYSMCVHMYTVGGCIGQGHKEGLQELERIYVCVYNSYPCTYT